MLTKLFDNPVLNDFWVFLTLQDETTQVLIGSFVFVIILTVIAKRNSPKHGYETDQPFIKADRLFLKLYPICIFASWLAVVAGLVLVGIGCAAYLGYIRPEGDFFGQKPLEMAVYACVIPFGAFVGIWRLSIKKQIACQRIAEHKKASENAGPIRSY